MILFIVFSFCERSDENEKETRNHIQGGNPRDTCSASCMRPQGGSKQEERKAEVLLQRTGMSSTYVSSTFFCTQCGRKGIPIPRSKNHMRETGHLKRLYCPYCRRVVNHVELSVKYTEEDFRKEFEAGSFDSNGMRKTRRKQINET
jgi:hypothetical protein